MIDGLKLTFSGSELRLRLEERIAEHERSLEYWIHERCRWAEDDTADELLVPGHMCANEEARHAWRAEVLQFIRDHIDAEETYRLSEPDLEFAELLPTRPEPIGPEDCEEGEIEAVPDAETKGPQGDVVDEPAARSYGATQT